MSVVTAQPTANETNFTEVVNEDDSLKENEKERRKQRDDCCIPVPVYDEDDWYIGYLLCRCTAGCCHGVADCTEACCEGTAECLNNCCNDGCCESSDGCCNSRDGCCDSTDGCCDSSNGGCCESNDTGGGDTGSIDCDCCGD